MIPKPNTPANPINYHQTQLNLAKKATHKRLKTERSKLLRLFDILFILSITFNLGALIITNILVVKETVAELEPNQTIEFREANPVMAKTHNYTVAQDGLALMLTLLKQIAIWTVITFSYIYHRNTFWNKLGFWFVGFLAIYLFTITSIDFVHDLGLLIGFKSFL